MTTIAHKEPDRVPVFHLLSTYGAKELGTSVEDYFSKSDHVVEAQLKMQTKYNNDCVYTFFYAPVEVEAFGAEVIFTEDGPPNSGEPFLKSFEQIEAIEIPRIKDSKPLRKVLRATQQLKKHLKDEVPVIGVVMSPYSLPVMQMGFEKYLEMLYFNREAFNRLMQVNQDFCVAWANAQLEAGATAICFFDPLASPTVIERAKYLQTGYPIAQETLGRIKGPTAMHLASGISLPVVDDLIATGTPVLGFSAKDDIARIKEKAEGRICLLGNLNGIDMIHWSREQTRREVKALIRRAAPGGGFILSDNHGEIPLQVPEEVLLEISETVRTHGTYPIIQE